MENNKFVAKRKDGKGEVEYPVVSINFVEKFVTLQIKESSRCNDGREIYSFEDIIIRQVE